MVKVASKSAEGKVIRRRRNTKRKKTSNIKEIDSDDERVKKQLNAKFKKKKKQAGDDGPPRLKGSAKKEQVTVKNSDKHDILLKRSQQSVLNRLNQVDCGEMKIVTRWKCALCQQRTLRSVLGDLFGPYIIRLSENYWPSHLAKRPQKLTKQAGIYCDIWLHGPCAVSAPGIYLVGKQLSGLQANIDTFWSQHCVVCSKEGAAIEDRGKFYHYLCALQKGMKLF